jgi:hypothetical protein
MRKLVVPAVILTLLAAMALSQPKPAAAAQLEEIRIADSKPAIGASPIPIGTIPGDPATSA